MNLTQSREALYEMVASYFKGATIVWVEQSNTKPKLPYITLRVGQVTRNENILRDADGKYYQCNVKVELNLYTKGKPVKIDGKSTGNYINTATADMADFFFYLDSDEGILKQSALGITLVGSSQVRDLSQLENDTAYRFRANAEATLYFDMDANGAYGMSGMDEATSSSGGGTDEMYTAEDSYFDEVEGGNND